MARELLEEIDGALVRALVAVGSKLSVAIPDTAFRERNLSQLLAAALDKECPQGWLCRREETVRLTNWANAGPVDLALKDAAGGTRALIELKWWKRSGGRYETLWDATKLATAARLEANPSTYLVSGGRSAIWAMDDGFTQLFETAVRETSSLFMPASTWWESPVNDRTVVPAVLRTTEIASVRIGDSHRVRCARVQPGRGDVAVPTRRPPRSTHQDDECPSCRHGKGIPIIWGLPSHELEERARSGSVVLGGCIIYGDERDPAWQCQQCGFRWGNA